MPQRLSLPRRDGPAGLLVQGDNLALFAALPSGSVDLVVTDPPFCSGRLRRPPRPVAGSTPPPTFGPPSSAPAGRETSAPAGETPIPDDTGFDDRWSSLPVYLDFLRARLVEIHRVLSPRGSAVVHLDHRAVHEVKLELDRIFGRERFVNEIIWHYTGGGRSRRCFSRKHDTLLWYARGDRWTFNIDAVRGPYKHGSGYARGGIVARSGKRYLPHPAGTPADDVWDIPIVNPLSPERCGFPTQKPERLLERVVLALSDPGDLVLDPFCGSGTTAVVAQRHGRRWIACDVSASAVAVARTRLSAQAAIDPAGPAGPAFRTARVRSVRERQEAPWSR